MDRGNREHPWETSPRPLAGRATSVRAIRAVAHVDEEIESARLRYPTRRVPLKRAGSSLAGPRVNDHRKPMCVTSQGPKPCSSVGSLTRARYSSF